MAGSFAVVESNLGESAVEGDSFGDCQLDKLRSSQCTVVHGVEYLRPEHLSAEPGTKGYQFAYIHQFNNYDWYDTTLK